MMIKPLRFTARSAPIPRFLAEAFHSLSRRLAESAAIALLAGGHRLTGICQCCNISIDWLSGGKLPHHLGVWRRDRANLTRTVQHAQYALSGADRLGLGARVVTNGQ